VATREFDLVVIGSGTGLDVANWAAQAGWRVALVEKGPLGGTCLNRGCIPSKLLIHSADVMETIRRAKLFGLHVGDVKVDFPAIVKRATDSVDADSQAIERGLALVDNPRLFRGEGRFVGMKRLRVGDDELVAPRFLLAIGARPRIPEVPGLRDVPFMTSTEALRRTSQPRSMIVLGGGYIASELAHFYGSLGTEVAIVHRHATLLNRGDSSIARRFTECYQRRFRLVLGAEPVAVRQEAGGIVVETQETAPGGARETLRAEALLVAVGVESNADTLDLDKTGVRLDARGYIAVDDFLETSAPGIFALGDAIGRFMFKHAANHEAPYVFQNLREPENRIMVDYKGVPHAVFAQPQVAGVGATEDDLIRLGEPYVVGTCRYRDTAMGHAIEDHDGFVKFLVDPATGEILGCHILGHEASTLIHEVVVAMRAGDGTIENVTSSIHVHPALNEVVQRAAGELAPPPG
jgi:dihydrolipoamide dehydrogenase